MNPKLGGIKPFFDMESLADLDRNRHYVRRKFSEEEREDINKCLNCQFPECDEGKCGRVDKWTK